MGLNQSAHRVRPMRWPLKFANLVPTLGLLVCAFVAPAASEQLSDPLPIGIPASASVAQSGSYYSWIDGSKQTMNFTNSTLSAQMMAPAWAPTHTNDPMSTGYGVRGAAGFAVPGGTVQFMTSYVNAGASQSIGINSGPDFRLSETNAGCGIGMACLDGLLSGTSYRGLQTKLKASSDATFGPVVVTPFATLFGKNAQSQQPILVGASATGWTDLGGTIGVETTFDVASRMLFLLRGSVGTAYRSTAFAAVQAGAGAVNANASGSPLLSTGEANFIWKPQSWQTIKAYAGVQFDSHAPVAPDQFGEPGVGGGLITYEAVRNYYFGASFKMEFEGLINQHF